MTTTEISELVEIDALPTQASPIARAMAAKSAMYNGSFSDASSQYFSYGRSQKGSYFSNGYSTERSRSHTMSPSEGLYGRRSSNSVYEVGDFNKKTANFSGDSCCGPKTPVTSKGHGGGCC